MVSRRTVLTASAGVALGTLAPVTPALAAAARDPKTRTIPRTISARRTLTNGRLRVETTAFQLTHLGVTWQGPHAMIRLRTKAGWTAWEAVSGCGGGPDRSGDPAGGSALLVVPETVGYDLQVVSTAEVTELNTVDGPALQAAAAVETGMPLPDETVLPLPYLSRAAWGADESLRFRNGTEYWPPEYYPTQTLTVHHTAGANNDPNPEATIRAIYYYQAITQDWGDIGYHLLIDEAGRVYEGRWSGTDAYPVFDAVLGADHRPRMSTGAHVATFNTGNVGVSLLGNFTDRQPTAAALDSLTTVLAGLARINGLDPRGTTNYVNPVNGMTRTVRTISGHRDWAPTQCPGNTFYPQLPALRDSVGARMSAPIALRAFANDRFVTAENAGASPLIANRTAVGLWELFDLVDAGDGYVALRAHVNGRYVAAESAGSAPLIANRGAIGSWEKFRIIDNADASISLRANANGLYVTAENGGATSLIANRVAIGVWEKFAKVLTLRAYANSRFVTAENAGASPLIANRTAVGLWELFDLVDAGDGYVALRAHVNGRYVAAESAGSAPLIANRGAIGSWERFRIIDNPDGSISLRANANGLYVTAENGGAASLIANRTAIGSWEKFAKGG